MQSGMRLRALNRSACGLSRRTSLAKIGPRLSTPVVRSGRGPLNTEEMNERLNNLEDELIATNVFDYLLPPQVRQVVIGFSSLSCLLAVLLGVVGALGNPEQAAANGAFENIGINLLGAGVFAGLFFFDRSNQEKRLKKRKAKRVEQLASGEREIVVDERTGRKTSRLKENDSDVMFAKLDAWAKKDNLPFVGPEKAAILRRLVKETKPKLAVEVGTMSGYSAIAIGQALSDDDQSRLVTIEKDLQWSLVARRFLSQFSDEDKDAKQRKVPLSSKIDVELGDAREKFAAIASKHGKFNFLFLDGVPKESLDYLKAAMPHLAPNCVVVADNAVVFQAGGMRSYVDFVRDPANGFESRTELCKLEYRPDVDDGMEVSVYKGSS